MIRRFVFAFFCAALSASAQHAFAPGGGPYDPAVPTPASVLGYEIGQRFTPHHLIVRYAERVAAASKRIRVDTVARTFEGREVLAIFATSERNQQRMAEIQADAARLAEGRADAVVLARMPAVVWLGYTVHGDEASGTEAALALLYQLAAGQDAGTRTILDSTVVIIDPVQNPDGHERFVHDVQRARGATGVPLNPGAMVHQGTWPGGRTSHYHFDLNRDWFVLSHPETRGRVGTFRKWWPLVAVDLHEMGSNSTYFFAPPMDPVNKNVHSSITKWWDIYAAANASAFDQHGWSFFRREGYDEFFPGYGVSWPILTGAAGMTYEQASSEGGAVRRTDGTVLTLHEAAWHHYTAAWATAMTTARRRSERLRDYHAFRQTAITDADRASYRYVVLERDPQGRADSLVATLQRNGITVRRSRGAGQAANAGEYGESGARAVNVAEGNYVVDLAQPQGRLARALLEPDAVLDSAFIAEEIERRRTAQPGRFYDMTAWSLPLMFRVRAWTARGVSGATDVVPHADSVARPATTGAAAVTFSGYGLAFEAGSEDAVRLLAGLLADSVRVWWAPRSFRSGEAHFPRGAFIVRAAPNDSAARVRAIRRISESRARVTHIRSAAVDDGTDLGSNSVIPVRRPQVALIGGPGVSGNAFGFTWYALEQRIGYPVTTVDAGSVAGIALEEFNVVIIPSAFGLDRPLGDAGRDRLAAWVRAGGVLITLDGATSWLAGERTGLARLRQRRDSTRADSTSGAPLPGSVPGAILRATIDTLSPLVAGVHQTEVPVLMFSDRVYTIPRDVRAGEVVMRYAPRPRLRFSGYLWPEAWDRIAGSPYLWTERVGRGRVIAFAGDPNFRDMLRGQLPIFANAVLLGASF